jgi:hypothetical protein
MSHLKLTAALLGLALAGAAQDTTKSKSRITDLEITIPEALQPIADEIKNVEAHQHDALAKQGKVIKDLQVRHQQAPSDSRIESQLYESKFNLATEIATSETTIAQHYDDVALKTRQIAAKMQPCTERPEIARQREWARQKLASLQARGADLHRDESNGGKAIKAQIEEIARDLQETAALLSKLDEAEHEQAKHCAQQTQYLAELNLSADMLSLEADLHYVNAAQATIESLMALIRLQDVAEKQTLNAILERLSHLQTRGFNPVHEMENIFGGGKK